MRPAETAEGSKAKQGTDLNRAGQDEVLLLKQSGDAAGLPSARRPADPVEVVDGIEWEVEENDVLHKPGGRSGDQHDSRARSSLRCVEAS